MADDTETAPDEQLSQDAADSADTAPIASDSPRSEGKADTRVHDAQAKLHEVTQSNAALRRELDELKGKLEATIMLRGEREPVKEEPKLFEYLDSESGDDDILDDPRNMKKFMKRVLGDMGALLAQRDQALLNEIKKNSPTANAMQAKLTELKQRPGYQGIGDDVLAQIAANMVSPVRGPAGGGRKPNAQVGETDVERMAKLGSENESGRKSMKKKNITADDVEVTTAAPQRRPMPDISVSDLFVNDRVAILKQLDEREPEYAHSYQSPTVDDLELERRGQERVIINGKQIHHGGDPVVKTPREFAARKSSLEHERSFAQVRNLAKDPQSLRKVATPVKVAEKTS